MVVLGLFWRDAIDRMMDVQFNLIERGNAVLTFPEPVDRAILRDLAHESGVVTVEGQRIVPVRLRAAQRTYLTSVVGLPQGGELRRPRDLALRPIDPPPEGITLIKRLAERLGVARGDIITVEVMEGHSAPGHTRRRNRRGNTRHVRLYGDRRAQPADRRRGCRFGRGSVHRTLGHRARHRAIQDSAGHRVALEL